MTDRIEALLASTAEMLVRRNDARVEDFLQDLPRSMPDRQLEPRSLPCARHLPATRAAATADTVVLVSAFEAARQAVRWGQTYTTGDLPQSFLDNYGWVELFGTRGHYENERIAGGFLLLGPGTHYPDHHHLAEEIYVPLTSGSFWRKGSGDFESQRAGEIIHHPSNVNHAMRTDEIPLLAFYLWRGGPLSAKSTLT